MNKSKIVILAVAGVLLVGFLLTSQYSKQPVDPPQPQAGSKVEQPLTRVRYINSKSQPVAQTVSVNGITEAGKLVEIRSEVESRIIKIFKQSGEKVEKNEAIVQLDLRSLPDQLRHAKALVVQRDLEYQGAQKLKGEGLLAKANLAESLANFELAKSEVKRIEQQIEKSTIRAPFSGYLDHIMVTEGDFLTVGKPIITLVNFTPFKVTGQIAEKDAGKLDIGLPAEIRTITGERYEGTVSFLARVADPTTRTFKVEVSVMPEDYQRVASGVTAEFTIETGKVEAHSISPALFELDEDGKLGIKAIHHQGNDVVVSFYPIDIVKADSQNVWVSGLPNTIDLITIGHGYVKAGDIVAADAEQQFARTDQ